MRTLARVDEVNRDKKRPEVSLDVYPYTASSTVLRYEFAEGSDTLITWSKGDPSATGKWLASLAEENGASLREMIERLQPAGAVYFTMSEEDVRKVLSHPMTMVGSDGLVCQVHPHPRLWGTFTRVLGHYCRDEKVCLLFSLSVSFAFLVLSPTHYKIGAGAIRGYPQDDTTSSSTIWPKGPRSHQGGSVCRHGGI